MDISAGIPGEFVPSAAALERLSSLNLASPPVMPDLSPAIERLEQAVADLTARVERTEQGLSVIGEVVTTILNLPYNLTVRPAAAAAAGVCSLVTSAAKNLETFHTKRKVLALVNAEKALAVKLAAIADQRSAIAVTLDAMPPELVAAASATVRKSRTPKLKQLGAN